MILSIEQGCFSYTKHPIHNILHNIEFTLSSGELLAILGPNGAGKTTLLKCIMGLLTWTDGNSTLDGENIAKIPASRLWQMIGYVPQAKSTVISYPVEEMILLGRSSHLTYFQKPKNIDVVMVSDVMKKLHIEHLSGKKCNEISGGELQMVLIAKALLSEPKILILDEPESNLDYKNQMIILDTMSTLVASGMTCIFNTHYPDHALQRANKALLLKKDGTYLFGPVNEVITEKNLSSSFGVNTVIGEIETPSRIIKDVIPLTVQMPDHLQDNLRIDVDHNRHQSVLAVISIIMNTNFNSNQINQIIHGYHDYLVGRMGMPYRDHQVYIINLTVDAPIHIIEQITQRLTMIPELSVKTTYEQLILHEQTLSKGRREERG